FHRAHPRPAHRGAPRRTQLSPGRRASLGRPRVLPHPRPALTLGVLAVGAFTYFFIPINLEQYVRLETWFPLSIAVLSVGWWLWERRLLEPIDRYLEPALGKSPPARDDPRAVAAYRPAQTLPYSLP